MKNRFIGLAAVYMLIPAMLLAQPAGKKQLVGVWAVKEVPVEQSQSPLLSLAMFGGDGSFTTGVGYKALPAISALQNVATDVGPGYGRWAATGDREFRLTFYSVMRKAGEVAGFQRVQVTLVLSESGDEYTGHAQVDFMDTDWNVVFSTTTEEKGTRLETPILSMPVGEPSGKKPLVGVWEVKVSPIGQSQSPLLSLAMYAGDGSFNTTGGYKALPSIPAVQDVATDRPRVRPMGRNGRQGVPADVLLRTVEGGPGKRIPASPGHVGHDRIGRRVHGTRPGGLFGCKLERRVQHHQRRERHQTRNTYSGYARRTTGRKKGGLGNQDRAARAAGAAYIRPYA